MNQKKSKVIRRIGKYLLILLLLVACTAGAIAFLLFSGQDPEEKRLYAQAVAQEAQVITDNLKLQIQQTTEEAKVQELADVPQTGIETLPADTFQKKLLEESLNNRYRGILEELKLEATGMLNGLLAQAKSDYEALKASGEKDPVKIGNLAGLYLDRVDIMESQMDASFNTLVTDMEEQLKEQGINPSPIISEYRTEYSQVKESNRKAFMDKATSMLN